MQIDKSFNKRNILEKIDMFGIDISIRFCKQMLHKTTTGGIFSIIVLGLITLQVIILVQQFIDKTNPQVLFQQGFTNLPEKYILSKDVFSLTIGVLDSKSVSYIDNSIYSIKVQMRIQKRVFNETKNAYDLISNDRFVKVERCTKEHFQNPQTRDYFLTQTYSQLYCIALSEKEVYVEGQYDGTDYSRLQIMVDMCQNSTTSTQICKSQDEINQKLTNSRFSLHYDDYSVVSKDIDNPFQAVGKVTFWISGPTLYKNLNLAMKNSYLYTDVGYLFKDIQKSRILSYSSDKEQTTPRTSSRLFDCFIQLERNVYQEYYRSYMKIDRALSQIGGIYNILFTLGCLLCKPISQIELNRKLLSSLFSFVNSDEDNNNDDKSPSKKEKPVDASQFDMLNNENHSFANNGQQIKKSSTLINNTNNAQGDGNQLEKQQSNKLNSPEQKLIQLKKLNSDIASNLKKSSIIESINQRNQKNSCYVNQKVEQEDFFKQETSKINSMMANSVAKTQAMKTDEDKHQQKQGGLQSQKSSIFNYFRKKNSSSITNNQLLKNIQYIQSIFNNSVKEIKFKSYEFFISSFFFLKCLRRRRHSALKYGIEKLYQHIDIFYITTKLIELEKLKSLLLNDQQLKMFEFIPRPVLKFSEKGGKAEQQLNGMKDDNTDWYDKMMSAQQALKELLNKGQQISFIDKRLLEILHPKFKNLNLSLGNETSKEIKDLDDINTNFEGEEINDITQERNQIRQTVPIQEKDFKNQSFDKIYYKN